MPDSDDDTLDFDSSSVELDSDVDSNFDDASVADSVDDDNDMDAQNQVQQNQAQHNQVQQNKLKEALIEVRTKERLDAQQRAKSDKNLGKKPRDQEVSREWKEIHNRFMKTSAESWNEWTSMIALILTSLMPFAKMMRDKPEGLIDFLKTFPLLGPLATVGADKLSFAASKQWTKFLDVIGEPKPDISFDVQVEDGVIKSSLLLDDTIVEDQAVQQYFLAGVEEWLKSKGCTFVNVPDPKAEDPNATKKVCKTSDDKELTAETLEKLDELAVGGEQNHLKDHLNLEQFSKKHFDLTILDAAAPRSSLSP